MDKIIYLLGCYFHQDWYCDAKNADEIIELFVRKESQNTINRLKAELEEAINNDENLTIEFIYENEGNYNPELDGLTVKEWFKRVLNILNRNS